MPRLIDFTGGGLPQKPLTADQIRSAQLIELLKSGKNRPQIQSIGEGAANLGTDVVNALNIKHARERAQAREAEAAKTRQQAFSLRDVDNLGSADEAIPRTPAAPASSTQPVPDPRAVQLAPSSTDNLQGFESSLRSVPNVGTTPQVRTAPPPQPAIPPTGQSRNGEPLVQALANRPTAMQREPTLREMGQVLLGNRDTADQGAAFIGQGIANRQAAGVRQEERTADREQQERLFNQQLKVLNANQNFQREGREDQQAFGRETLGASQGFTREQQDRQFANQKEVLEFNARQRKEELKDSQNFQGDLLLKKQGFQEKLFKQEQNLKRKELQVKKDIAAAKNQSELQGKTFTHEKDLRKEYTKESGEFIKVRDSFGRIQASVAEPSPAGDLAMIFNFMKMLDPGSTVREGEFATAANAGSIPTRITAIWNKLRNGERLADEQRKDFFEQSLNLFSTMEQSQGQLKEQFTGIAGRNGLNPENIVLPFDVPKFEKPSLGQFGLEESTFAKGTGGATAPVTATPELPPGFEIE